MQRKLEILFLPDDRTVSLDKGRSVRDAALEGGITLSTPCGGQGICGGCRVRLRSGETEGAPDEEGYHLGCRTFPLSDCVIEIPEFSRSMEPLALVRTAIAEVDLDPPALAETPPDDPLRKAALGVACDVGTTTVVAALAHLETGEIASVAARGNPQAVHGEDVISRIARASSSEGPAELQRLILGCLDDLVADLCEQAALERAAIVDVVAAGNAAMMHLLLGASPESLGKAPYRPAFVTHEPVPLTELGLSAHASAHLRALPNIAGFIGGDAVAGIISTGLHRSESLRLFIDIGTNGEIVLGDKRELLACSTAAGPAFEGGRISGGMRAEPGAIDHVLIGDDVRISTIGNQRPRGICGTGLIEAVAGMLSVGIIDEKGRLVPPEESQAIPQALRQRLKGKGGSRRFSVVVENGDGISITQNDISELLLAKAAIRSGVETLLDERGGTWAEVEEVLIAGAFGSFLCATDVLRIGLIPLIDHERIRFVGNTALGGALKVLLSRRHADEAEAIAASARFVDLAATPEFQEAFVSAMRFPAERG